MSTIRFALFGNKYQKEKTEAIRQVVATLMKRDAQITVDEDYYRFLITIPGFPGTPHSPEIPGQPVITTFRDNDFTADFALSMGGDGTLLKTASLIRDRQIPIVGVNMGRLGFLADADVNDFEQTLDALYCGDYSTDDRALIRVETDGEPLDVYECALNDVAILKRDTASMISIRASINGEYLTTYQADGLIVSTPTGSTAYSMSNGGPIIAPRTGVMLMTAVAPHSLNVRPIVLPDTSLIELTVSSRSHKFLVAVDGRSCKLPEGTTLRLTRAPYTVSVVKHRGARFFDTLREKLMWGADLR